MTSRFRFAIISDPHIALPHTIWDNPHRFHLVEVSVPALEQGLAELATANLDFLLLPGDLTQHGEWENHQWLVQRLTQLPYPVYVVPGNHDIIARDAAKHAIGLRDFPQIYEPFGYASAQPYYTCEILPGVRLIGLNSIAFDADGIQLPAGWLDEAQLHWLAKTLAAVGDDLVLVMVHHNVLEHLPGQARHGMGKRYMLHNAADLLALLEPAGVKLIFTGHLHVQDVAQRGEIYEITTGSLVSYPHPYRVLTAAQDDRGQWHLDVETTQIQAVPGWDDLQTYSRDWMGDRSFSFMHRLLTLPPLALADDEATAIAPHLRHFWADIAQGDAWFDFSHLPPAVHQFLHRFSALDAQGNYQPVDNRASLRL
ncbi:MAG: metallophosphoesterase [Cyanobacteria bacterium J069]|nr:MAG: metallophosphoesterase [Cyanobacteria bacterium J069]